MAGRDCIGIATIEPLTEDEEERTLRAEFRYEEWRDFKGYYGMAPAYQTECEISDDRYYLDGRELSIPELEALLGPERAERVLELAIEDGIARS